MDHLGGVARYFPYPHRRCHNKMLAHKDLGRRKGSRRSASDQPVLYAMPVEPSGGTVQIRAGRAQSGARPGTSAV
jgi:hypothetical protein